MQQTDDVMPQTDDVSEILPRYVLYVGALREGADADYAAQKLRHAADVPAAPDEAYASAAAQMAEAVATLRIAERADHPALDDRHVSVLDRRQTCFLDLLAARGDLLFGETVEEDFFTYTTAPFQGLPAGTALLRRTTNMAVLYYLIQNVAVTPAGQLRLQRVEPDGGVPARGRPVVRAAAFDGEALATQAAKRLAGALVSSLGGAIGGAIWEAVFPPGVPTYFDKVYEEISRRINQAIREETIRQINSTLITLRNTITDEYRPMRQGADLSRRDHREALFQLLDKYGRTYLHGTSGMLGTLMESTYANAGFGPFLLGAGLHLALYQESALVDPNNRAPDNTWRPATSSSYAATVALAAKRYLAHAKATWGQLQEQRRNQIKYKEYETTPMTMHGGGIYILEHAAYSDGAETIEDEIMGSKKKDGSSPTRDQVKANYAAYRERKLNELAAQLSHPATIYAQWEKLLAEPISQSLMQSPRGA